MLAPRFKQVLDRSGVGITGLFLASVPHIFIYADRFVVKSFVGLW